MQILQKYIISKIFKSFIFVNFAIMSLFFIIEYLSRMASFFDNDVSLLKGVLFVLYEIPFMFAFLMPVSVLLSVVASFAIMNKNNEFIVLRSSGINVFHLAIPILFLSLFFSSLMFSTSEIFVPITMEKANKIVRTKINYKDLTIKSKSNDIWIKNEKRIINIKKLNREKKEFEDIFITFFSQDFKLQKRLFAKRAKPKKDKLILYDVTEEDYSKDYQKSFFEKKDIDIIINMELFNKNLKTDELSFFTLRKYIKFLEAEGKNAAPFKVDLHSKISFAFLCILFSLLGLAISYKAEKTHSFAFLFINCILVIILYWLLNSFFLSLGYNDFLNPFLSAWFANFVLTLWLVYLFLEAEMVKKNR